MFRYGVVFKGIEIFNVAVCMFFLFCFLFVLHVIGMEVSTLDSGIAMHNIYYTPLY